MMLNVPLKRNQSKQNLNQTTRISIRKHEFKNIVCEMAAVFRGLNLLVKFAQEARNRVHNPFWLLLKSHYICR